ncbi:MAG: hypothetical protein COB42_08760, partial [Sulfurimonas sp.]
LADLVQTYKGSSGHRFRVSLNNGNGFGEVKYWLSDSNTNLSPWNLYAQDMNGDGLADLVQTYKGTGGHRFDVGLNNGNGFNQPVQWYSTNNSGYSTYNIYAQDMNGDGLADLVQTYKGTGGHRFDVGLNNGKPPKIKTVTNSKDQTLNINYTTLRDTEVYTAYEDSLYPQRDIKASGMYVVKSLSVEDAIGGLNTTSFKYEGLKLDFERGSLGFAKIQTYNDISNTKTLTEFHQAFPFVGIAKNSKSYLGDTLISEETSTINQVSYFTNANILNLEISTSEKKEYDIDGVYLRSSLTTNSNFDKYGNIGTSQSTTTDGTLNYSQLTQSLYTNDESKWILSRLTNASVTHTHANATTLQKSSAFTYNETTGTLRSETIEPAHAKALTKSYTYDAYGNKITETVSAAGIASRTTKYQYDAKGKNLLKMINPLGHTSTSIYDANNQVIQTTDVNGLSIHFFYDAMGKKIKEIYPDGRVSTWTHSWDSSLANSLYKVVQTTTGSPQTVVYFNQAGQKLRTVQIGFDGSLIYEDTFYDALGRVIKSTPPYYSIDTPEYIYNTYDALGRILELDRAGASGERIQHSYSYDGLNLTTTNPKGQTKTIQTNIMGKKVKVIDGDTFVNYTYDALGNLLTTTDSKGNVISLSYDVFGNKITMDDPDMGSWSYEYNALGQLTEQTDAKGQVSTMTYDILGRMITRVELEGTTTWTYDRSTNALGKLSYTQADNYKKEYYYDGVGRVASIKEFIDANVFSTSYEYNAEGKLFKTTRPDGFIVVNEYNNQGYLSAVKSPKYTNDLYTYDEIKNAIEQSLAISMEYAQEAVEYSNKAEEKQATANLFVSLALDTDNASLQSQLNETASLAVQAALLLKSASEDAQAESTKALNKVNYFLNLAKKYQDADFYEYVAGQFREQTRFYVDIALTNLDNAINSLDKLLNDTSMQTAYIQEEIELLEAHIAQTQLLLVAANGLSQKVLNYKQKHEDALLMAEAKTSSTYLDMLDDENYTYYYKILQADEFGRVINDIVGNGLITNKEYNKANGQLNYISTGYNGSNDVRDIHYEYDSLDNVLSKTDNIQAISSSYSYDSINRISSASITGESIAVNISYTYDSIGNIVNKSDLGSYTYAKAHQVTSAGGHLYEYDLNGNVVKKDNIDIRYTSYNKPTQIQDADNTTNFYYAPNRARYKKTLNGGVTYYAGKLFEKEIKDAKVSYKNFIYAGSELVAVNVEVDDGELLIPSVRYFHKDALGSIDTITNESGEVVQRFVYKPFGERIVGSWINQTSESNSITKRGFTGHEHISEFNLIHMNGRVYDPIIGRFLSADPYIQSPYDTQSYNRYSYVKNNPLKYTDPSGFFYSANIYLNRGGSSNFSVSYGGFGSSYRINAYYAGQRQQARQRQQAATRKAVQQAAAKQAAQRARQVQQAAARQAAQQAATRKAAARQAAQQAAARQAAQQAAARQAAQQAAARQAAQQAAARQAAQQSSTTNFQGGHGSKSLYFSGSSGMGATHLNVRYNTFSGGGSSGAFGYMFGGENIASRMYNNAVDKITFQRENIKYNMAKSFSTIENIGSNTYALSIASGNLPAAGLSMFVYYYGKVGLRITGYGPSTEDMVQGGFIDYMTPNKTSAIIAAEAVKLYTKDP